MKKLVLSIAFMAVCAFGMNAREDSQLIREAL
jgi:hypothetical protein